MSGFPTTRQVSIDAGGEALDIEYRWIGDDPTLPVMVFLHEGLGSVAMWRDFPDEACRAAGMRGLVYSRPGYGNSTPRSADRKWGLDFMHVQALVVLPALLQALGIDARRDPPWLVGHSDGGSITLIYAASFPDRVAGAVVMAPHINVEEFGLVNIRKAREDYLHTDLRSKLARYHRDVDSAFWGWNDIWLDPAFPQWTIEALLPQIRCPLLAIQGWDDLYGTMEHIDGIQRVLPDTRLLKLEHCGHSPHRDCRGEVVEAIQAFAHTNMPVQHRQEVHAP